MRNLSGLGRLFYAAGVVDRGGAGVFDNLTALRFVPSKREPFARKVAARRSAT